MKNIIKVTVGPSAGWVGRRFHFGWTLAGTGLVLITLSSTTLQQGIYISLPVLHTFDGHGLDYVDDERENASDNQLVEYYRPYCGVLYECYAIVGSSSLIGGIDPWKAAVLAGATYCDCYSEARSGLC